MSFPRALVPGFFLLTVALAACSPPPASEGGFHSPDPASRLYAIHRAGEQRDRRAVPDLVEQLDNDDPVVRLMTIQALDRITGTRLGYNPYAPPAQRREAIDRWVAAVHERRFTSSESSDNSLSDG